MPTWLSKKLQIIILSMLAMPVMLFAQCTELAQPMPEGLSAYYVLEAEKTVAGNVADDPAFFHSTLLSRDQTQIDAKKTEAISYFQTEFGLTVDGSDIVTDSRGAVVGDLRETMLNQDADLRVIAAGNQYVPEAGWPSYLRRHWIAITNPQGAYLGGNYFGPSGGYVPKGSSLSYGELHIIVNDSCGATGTTYTYTYKSTQPVVPDYQYRGVLLYEVEGIASTTSAVAFARGEASGSNTLVRWIIKGKS